MQLDDEAAPGRLRYVPAAHEEHEVLCDRAAKKPAAQFAQAVAAARCAKVPGEHAVQAEAPAAEYLPGEQLLQSQRPELPWTVPDAQLVQLLEAAGE